MNTSMGLGLVYACLVPFFYCRPEKTIDEKSKRVDESSASANQTLVSTIIRITGLRGQNLVKLQNKGAKPPPEIRIVSPSLDEHSSKFLTATSPSMTQSIPADIDRPDAVDHVSRRDVSTQTEYFAEKGTCTSETDFLEPINSRELSRMYRDSETNTAGDEQRNYSLYPDVNVVVRGNISTSTAQQMSLPCVRGSIEESENLSSARHCSQPLSNKSRIKKDKLSRSIMKRCKKFWTSVNSSRAINRSEKSKSSVTSVITNNPTGHSTLKVPIYSSRTPQGQLNFDGCESWCKKSDTVQNNSTKYRELLFGTQTTTDPFHIPQIITDNIYDDNQPLDLSNKFASINASDLRDSTCTDFRNDLNQVVQGVRNYLRSEYN